MDHKSLASMARRIAFALLVFGLIPACGGGGGGSSAPPPPPGMLSGTAAKGLAVSGAAVLIEGSNGVTVAATTAVDGTYTANVSALTAPYLVRVDIGAGNFLYSVGSTTGTVNVTPFTDLIVREYYQVQALSADAEFTSPTVTFPTPSEIQIIQNVVNSIVSGWLVQAGLDPSTFNLITSPFVADGSGIDGILDLTTTSQPSANTIQVVIANTNTTQTSDVTSSSSQSSITSNTTTVDTSGTSSSTTSTIVPTPTTSALQTATDEVNALLAQFQNTVNSRGALLADSDLLPYGAAALLDDGRNRTVWAGFMASDLRGQTLQNFSILQVVSFDNTTDPTSPELLANVFGDNLAPMLFKKIAGSWTFYGNRRLADIGLQVENRRDESASIGAAAAFKKSINGDIRPPQGAVSAITIRFDPAQQTNAASTTWVNGADNPWPTATNVPKNSGTDIQQYQPTPGSTTTLLRDLFFFNWGAWPGTTLNSFPPPGTLLSVAITPSSGPVQTYLVSTNATTTSTFVLTSPTNYLLASANLGGTMTMSWTPPAGFLIGSLDASGICFTASSNQSSFGVPTMTPTTTSAAISMPATLDPGTGPQPVTSVNLNVSITGTHGERMIIIHVLDQGPANVFVAGGGSTAMGFVSASDGTNYLVGLQVADGTAIDHVKAQLISSSGSTVGSVIDMGRTGGVPFGAFDGTNYLVTWGDSGAFGNGISAQLVSSTGALVGSTIDIARTTDISGSTTKLDQGGIHNVVFDGSNYFVTFFAQTNTNPGDLYGVFVSTSGTRVGGIIPVCTVVPHNSGEDYSLSFDGTNILVVFADGRRQVATQPTDIYGQFISKSSSGTPGALVGSNFLINQNDLPSYRWSPQVAYDGTNNLVTWLDETATNVWNIFGQRISSSGASVGGVLTLNGDLGDVAFGGNSYLTVFQVVNPTTSRYEVHGRYVDKTGSFLGAEFVIAADSSQDQFFPSLLYAGGQFAVSWVSGDVSTSKGTVLEAFIPPQ